MTCRALLSASSSCCFVRSKGAVGNENDSFSPLSFFLTSFLFLPRLEHFEELGPVSPGLQVDLGQHSGNLFKVYMTEIFLFA